MNIFYIYFINLPIFLIAQSSGNICSFGLNNGFETPFIKKQPIKMIDAGDVPNWSTTAPDNIIEICSTGTEGVTTYEGKQFAELNANYKSTLIKSFICQAGVSQIINFAHRGRWGTDVMSVQIGPKGGPFISLGTFSDGKVWRNYSRPFMPLLSGAYELQFISVSSAGVR